MPHRIISSGNTMHNESFEAKNDLEQKLLAAMNGELSSDDFMRELMAGQVFMPVKDDADSGIKPGTRFEDLPAGWVCPVCGADKSAFEKI